MPAIANSKVSQISEQSAGAPRRVWIAVILAALSVSAVTASAVWLSSSQGWTLYYGDAEAHLNIARRILDSRTPGFEQLGTAWLPLAHVLMLPFVMHDFLWFSGLGGAIASGICFSVGAVFFFGAIQEVFSRMAASAATALVVLNPNALYLATAPMSEPVFFAAFSALLYFTVRFRRTQALGSAVAAGVAALAGTLTRYEGWFLIPFATLYFLITARRRRMVPALVFGAIATIGPAAWLVYNRWFCLDALAFYRGPYSAKAIQGGIPYPGNGNWQDALLYFGWAVRACAGAPLFFMGIAGALAALWKRALWPLILLLLPGAFYVWSVHSSGNPIFLPNLATHSYYNTRYGLALLPLLAFCSGAIVAAVGGATAYLRARLGNARLGWMAAAAVLAVAIAPWLLEPRPESWITWKESQVNSEARRAWTHRAAAFFKSRYQPGEGILTSFGDAIGVMREAGIPLRATLTIDNGPLWEAAIRRPDLVLWEQWALARGGDPVQTAVDRARRRGPNYDLAQRIIVAQSPVMEIYERRTAPADALAAPYMMAPADETPSNTNEDSLPQSARREK